MMVTYDGGAPHYPVMMPEVLEALAPVDGEIYVDGTFGAGGYTRNILAQAQCRVFAIDRDAGANVAAQALADQVGGRLHFVHGCFGDVEALLARHGFGQVDGFVLDLGVSSMQIDQADRGFSFRFDGPLDMRMDQLSGGQTAADIVNTWEQERLADMIYLYGEERHSRRVARKIVTARADRPFTRTNELAEAVRAVVPKKPGDRIDAATRTFQALRIAVNDELGELERALESALRILKPEGRLVVVSFHSLEDGLVKRFMQEKSETQAKGSRHMPEVQAKAGAPMMRVLVRKAVKPSEREVEENPRSRSARLRASVRTSAPYSGEGV